MGSLPLNDCGWGLLSIADGQMGPLGNIFLELLFQPSLTCWALRLLIHLPSSLTVYRLNEPELNK